MDLMVPMVKGGRDILLEGGVPDYLFPEQTIKAFAGMVRWREYTEKPPLSPVQFDGFDSEAIEEIFKKHEESIKFLGSYIKEGNDV